MTIKVQKGEEESEDDTLFYQEYLCEFWIEGPERKRLRELAEEYCVSTEAYDRTVCTGPIHDGEVRPATGRELALINRNARAVRRRLLPEVLDLGFTPKDFREQMSRIDMRSRVRRKRKKGATMPVEDPIVVTNPEAWKGRNPSVSYPRISKAWAQKQKWSLEAARQVDMPGVTWLACALPAETVRFRGAVGFETPKISETLALEDGARVMQELGLSFVIDSGCRAL